MTDAALSLSYWKRTHPTSGGDQRIISQLMCDEEVFAEEVFAEEVFAEEVDFPRIPPEEHSYRSLQRVVDVLVSRLYTSSMSLV